MAMYTERKIYFSKEHKLLFQQHFTYLPEQFLNVILVCMFSEHIHYQLDVKRSFLNMPVRFGVCRTISEVELGVFKLSSIMKWILCIICSGGTYS